jgi:hypothetical protein
MSGGRFQRGGQPTISFFAFQDIITAVSGILVIVTLLLALHLDEVTPVSTDDEPASPESAAELDARLTELSAERAAIERLQAAQAISDPAALEAEIAKLKQQLAAANSRRAQQDAMASSVKANRAGDAVEVEAEAARRKLQANAEKLAELERRAAESAAAMAELERQVKERQAALLAEQQRRNDLWLIPQKSSTSKEPVLVIVEDQAVALQRFGQTEPQRVRRTREFTEALKTYSKLDHYLVFYFKPSGADRFKELGSAARDAGFEIGYDAIGEDANLRFGPRPIDLRK